MLTILPVPILKDNYVWLGHRGTQAFVVDPGDADPVLAELAAHGLSLTAILLTHHHADHTGGVAQLAKRWACPVYGPASIELVTHPVHEGEAVMLDGIEASFNVLAVPGHTLDHIAYYARGILFCGDTLFACGCGRLFEGTAEQMQASLAKLACLPDDTRVYCTHEYTLSNQRFALAVEPDNAALAAREAADAEKRVRGEPTLPSTIALERATNPFLRWAQPTIAAAAAKHGATNGSPAQVFGAIRRWKDVFV
jgi:hydroxyacylglutathione hydrolase